MVSRRTCVLSVQRSGSMEGTKEAGNSKVSMSGAQPRGQGPAQQLDLKVLWPFLLLAFAFMNRQVTRKRYKIVFIHMKMFTFTHN